MVNGIFYFYVESFVYVSFASFAEKSGDSERQLIANNIITIYHIYLPLFSTVILDSNEALTYR